MVSGVDGSVPRGSNPAVRRGSRSADSRHPDRRRGDEDSSLPAIKSTHVETLRAILRAKGHSRGAAHMLFMTHHFRCMNPIGQDSCPSVGRKDGTCFESEVIISAPIWCISSETDFSQRRLFHIARLWLLCYVIGFMIRQPNRTSRDSSELSDWKVRCNAELCPSGTFILCFHLYWNCHSHQSAIFKRNSLMTSFP